jgi:hypothetical protein
MCVPALFLALQLRHNIVVLQAGIKEAVRTIMSVFWCDARERMLLTRDTSDDVATQ